MATEVKPRSNRILLIFGVFLAALAFAGALLLGRTPGGGNALAVGFQVTQDTHDLSIAPGSPQQIPVDGTLYAISVLRVFERPNERGQYRYAELEISW